MLGLPLTEDATLRALEPWQAAEFAEHVDRIREHLAPWIGWTGHVVDEDSAREFLQRYADDQARGEGRIYGIWIGEELVGGTLFRVFEPRMGVCEVGVWLAPEAEGQGLVNRAARHMIEWAVRVRGMQRVEWRTVPDNARSIAAAKRLGMRRDGVLRSAYPHNGKRHDIEIYAILANEID